VKTKKAETIDASNGAYEAMAKNFDANITANLNAKKNPPLAGFLKPSSVSA
jgi:hypothetical protein